jgi:hypothetical protein
LALVALHMRKWWVRDLLFLKFVSNDIRYDSNSRRRGMQTRS